MTKFSSFMWSKNLNFFCRTQRHMFLCWSVDPVGAQIHSSCFEQPLWSDCSSFIYKHNQMSNAQCLLLSLYCQYLSVSLSVSIVNLWERLIAECCSLLFASSLTLCETCECTYVCVRLSIYFFCVYMCVSTLNVHTHLILFYMNVCLSIPSYSQCLVFTNRYNLQKASGVAWN